MLHNLNFKRTVVRSILDHQLYNFHTQLSAIIVLVFVPCCYEIGCLRYLPRGRKKEDTVVTSRSSEQNELYHSWDLHWKTWSAWEKTSVPLSSLPRLSRLVIPKVLHFGFAGSADVKIFINCVLAGRGDDTSPENVSGCALEFCKVHLVDKSFLYRACRRLLGMTPFHGPSSLSAENLFFCDRTSFSFVPCLSIFISSHRERVTLKQTRVKSHGFSATVIRSEFNSRQREAHRRNAPFLFIYVSMLQHPCPGIEKQCRRSTLEELSI